MSIVVFDGRTASPTFGAINEFKVSDRNPTLLVIPPDLYHGWKNIGTSEAFVINMPTVQYDVSAHHRHWVRGADEGGRSRFSPSWRSAVGLF